jgi:protein O-GlcNAc transferase
MTIVSEQDIKSLVKQAILHHQSGQLEAAEKLYRSILEVSADITALPEKIQSIYPLILIDFGTVLQKQNKYSEAIHIYQKSMSLKPDLIDGYNNLGIIFQKQNKLDEAIHIYQRGLRVNPNWAEGYNKIGSIFREKENFKQAQRYYQKAIQANPNFALAYNNLGNIFKDQGKLDEAVQVYQKAIKINPKFAGAYHNLGYVFRQQENLGAAVQACQMAITLNPDLAEAYYNLATVLQRQGKLQAAIEFYQRALKINSQFYEAEFGICMSQLPIIYKSCDEVKIRREQYQQYLQKLVIYYQQLSSTEKKEAAKVVGTLQPFYLSYQGLNDRPLQQIYGEMIHQLMACRYPQYTQPLSLPKLQPNEKIRVGFVSGFFRSHSNWKIPIKGWVENLNREQFQLYGYHTSARQDQYTQEAQNAFEQFIQGPLPLSQWCEQIKADNLHVLIFPEFGMDPTTIQLGCLRLAPIQMSSWGHPETSGLPTIDYYLSSELMEPEIAEDCYSETLIKLPNLSIHYTPLEIPPQQKTKAELGMKEEDIFFWCCQSLYKYLPQHDDVFSQIAQQVKKSKFVFIKHIGDNSEQITTVFTQRLEKAFAESGLNYQDYCLFLPRLKSDEFAGVTAIADIFLDSMGWSGCNSSLEAIAQNLPIITLPGELMRGRHTAAILKMMGLTETIASDKQQYIQLAVKLATDKNYRQGLRQSIEENKHKLYQDLAPVRALENFLFSVVHDD